MSAGRKTNAAFVPALTGLRGLAVLYVLLSHMGLSELYLIPYLRYEHIGKMGVVIFFVLSSYLLTTKLTEELRAGGREPAVFGAYLIHRLFRIYPLFLLVLVLHVLVGNFDAGTALLHALLQRGFRELWAIAVEFKYYFCMPLVAWAAVRFGTRVTLAVLGVLMGAWMVYALLNPLVSFDNDIALSHKLLPFLAGSSLALAAGGSAWPGGGWKIAALGWSSLGLLAAATVVFHLWWPEHLSAAWLPWIMLATTLAACGLTRVSLESGIVSALLGSKPLVFFGDISFSVYLLHEFIVGVVLHNSSLPLPLKPWLALLLVAGIAWLSYRVIERPGIKLGYRLGKRLFTGHAGKMSG